MNQYALWKYLVVLVMVSLGTLYSLPNLYRPDPAIQISGESAKYVLDQSVANKLAAALDESGISHQAPELGEKNIQVRLTLQDQQLAAREVVQRALGDGYVVALNLAPTTPEWLTSIGAKPMKLGLDLSGGVHFLYKVDTDFAINKRLDGYKTEMKSVLREANVRGFIMDEPMELKGKFSSAEIRDQALKVITDKVPDLTASTYEDGEGFWIRWVIGEGLKKRFIDEAIEQNLTALRNRVNELGVSEPLVQRQGTDGIVVELPGVQDSAGAKRIIGKIASLEFRLEADAQSLGKESFRFREGSDRRSSAELERAVVITGEQVSTASSSFDENGRPQVNITLDGQGGKQMNAATRNNIGRNLGVLFIEQKTRTVPTRDAATGEEVITRVPYVQREIISLATIQSALGVQFRITGLDSPQEAKDLALLLRAGALSAPIIPVEERTIGPSLGAENIAAGVTAVVWGMVLVVIFMVLYYRIFGIFANIALGMNIVLLVAVMSTLSATLTLPGLAGIVLTVGMAVDANVLIFSRIREEINNGMKPHQAVVAGYERAFITILDSNLTTLLVAVILYLIGTGSVKGFAVTLSIGILTSMFTAILGTRALVQLFYANRPINQWAL